MLGRVGRSLLVTVSPALHPSPSPTFPFFSCWSCLARVLGRVTPPGEELLKQCRAQHGGTQTCVLIDGPLHAANVGCIMLQARHCVSGMFMSFPSFLSRWTKMLLPTCWPKSYLQHFAAVCDVGGGRAATAIATRQPCCNLLAVRMASLPCFWQLPTHPKKQR